MRFFRFFSIVAFLGITLAQKATIRVIRPPQGACTFGGVVSLCDISHDRLNQRWMFKWAYDDGWSYINERVGQTLTADHHSQLTVPNVTSLLTDGRILHLKCFATDGATYLISKVVTIPYCNSTSELQKTNLEYPLYPPFWIVSKNDKCAGQYSKLRCYVPGDSGPWKFAWFVGCTDYVKVRESEFQQYHAYSELTLDVSKIARRTTQCFKCVISNRSSSSAAYASASMCEPDAKFVEGSVSNIFVPPDDPPTKVDFFKPNETLDKFPVHVVIVSAVEFEHPGQQFSSSSVCRCAVVIISFVLLIFCLVNFKFSLPL